MATVRADVYEEEDYSAGDPRGSEAARSAILAAGDVRDREAELLKAEAWAAAQPGPRRPGGVLLAPPRGLVELVARHGL